MKHRIGAVVAALSVLGGGAVAATRGGQQSASVSAETVSPERQKNAVSHEATHSPNAHASPDEVVRPIDARDDPFIENLTWLEVRDAVRAGKTNVIIGAGAVEQNGPYTATAKHNFILRLVLPIIARKLGNTLIAPIVPFSPPDDPEGQYHAGTIDLSQGTFEALLEEMAENLRRTGFREVFLIPESKGNRAGMIAVAERLTQKWKDTGARVHYVREYYDNKRWDEFIVQRGIQQKREGIHDNMRNSSLMAAYDPGLIRMSERRKVNLFRVNGVELDPLDHTIEIGRALAEYTADTAVAAMRGKLEASSSASRPAGRP